MTWRPLKLLIIAPLAAVMMLISNSAEAMERKGTRAERTEQKSIHEIDYRGHRGRAEYRHDRHRSRGEHDRGHKHRHGRKYDHYGREHHRGHRYHHRHRPRHVHRHYYQPPGINLFFSLR